MSSKKTQKRSDYISWEEYFMGVALLSAQRSKDPNTQVGACIVNEDQRIVGIGYNGLPKGCLDEVLPWNREGDFLDTKYPYIVHAEVNAVLNSNSNMLANCKMYVALFPCNECAKIIIQSGIKEVIYLADKYAGTDQVKAAKLLFEQAGVSYRKLSPERASLTIDFSRVD
jgi:dCMP deaminase